MKLSLVVAACLFLGAAAPAQEKQAKKEPAWKVVDYGRDGKSYLHGQCSVHVSADMKLLSVSASDSALGGVLQQTFTVRWGQDGPVEGESFTIYNPKTKMYWFPEKDTVSDVFGTKCRSAADELPAEVRKLFAGHWAVH